MTKLPAIFLALLMAAPVMTEAPEASAHAAPYKHYHTNRRPRVYVPARPVYVAPRRAVIVHDPPPVVIIRPRRRRVIVTDPGPVVVTRRKRQARKRDRMYFGVGLRATTSLLDGVKIGMSQEENSPMGGVGLTLKARFSRHWGLELSADYTGGGGDNHTQVTVPVMAAVTFHFMPESRFQPYLLAGAGVHFTSLDYLDGRYKIDLVEAAGQLGAGAEFFITKWLSLNADLRFQTVFKNIDTQARIREDCLSSVGSMTGFCNGINSADPEDKLNLGLSFQLGASIYF